MILDRYVHPAPEEGWPLWMDRNLDEAQFVLLICTEAYRRRVMGQEEPGEGLGVRWEGRLIYNRIYNDRPSGSRFIPILLTGSEPAHIPNPVQGHIRYRIAAFDISDPGYEGLYRHLTGQPATPRPDLGALSHPAPETTTATLLGPSAPSGGPMTNETRQTIPISNIFPTTGIPTFNYVPPVEYARFKAELQTLGKGLVVEGPSRTGKTTATRKAIEEIAPRVPIVWIDSRNQSDIRSFK